MEILPSELRTQILCRLPAKSLVRFRCVSKHWASLFAEPYFAKFHCHQQNLHLIVSNGLLYSLDWDSFDCALRVDHFLKDSNFKIKKVLGCSNFLLCLLVSPNPSSKPLLENDPKFLCNLDDVIVICDLTSGAHHIVPFSPVDFQHQGFDKKLLSFCYGFGFDPSGNDHKLVRIVQSNLVSRNGHFLSEIKVYTVKTKSWTKLHQDLAVASCFVSLEPALFVNGALHWMASTWCGEIDYRKLVLAFDLADGARGFRVLPFPDNMRFISMGSMAGRICVLCTSDPSLRLQFWVMEEYGHWTPLFSLSSPKEDFVSDIFLSDASAWALSKSGDKVLVDGIFYFDFTKKATMLEIQFLTFT